VRVRASTGPRAVSTTSEHVVWTDEHEASVYLMMKRTSSSDQRVRTMKTAGRRLSALTVASPTASVTHRKSPFLVAAKTYRFYRTVLAHGMCCGSAPVRLSVRYKSEIYQNAILDISQQIEQSGWEITCCVEWKVNLTRSIFKSVNILRKRGTLVF